MFFFLVQSEQGDIFKVTLEIEDDMVRCAHCYHGKDGGYITIRLRS